MQLSSTDTAPPIHDLASPNWYPVRNDKDAFTEADIDHSFGHPMPTGLRIANITMLCAFVLSGVMQHNDPDPWGWMALYTVAACICLVFHMRRLPWYLSGSLVLFATGWFVSLLPEVMGQVSFSEIWGAVTGQENMNKENKVEEVREAGGTLMVAAWSYFLCRFDFLARRKTAESGAETPQNANNSQ